ncbi:GntR family transcriptional regulator [Curtobacterium sp. VKM Ac-2884]|uniref:GntR family transcriptional regulator n=1 Tax=Curtobacterium sp. VKM Ac-2884 TaxID=2783818 RepID=UPI00188BF56F|nr:GntR family transcriptional regulator [Curtobacterium sp. VKM Ac-2884]MBF4605430.1 GntR family transcriptional regulator [Curtobacterium sp. VKM Ac-2884]
MEQHTTTQAASERAYDHVKRAIIRGDLPGGTAISENALCQEIGLSRTPVHEAFLRLAAEDLLTLESRKGAVVRPMSPNEAADVLEMREAIEATAAARVVTDGRVADVTPGLQAMLTEQEQAVATGDVDRFIEVDAAFHGAVIGASRNAIAVRFAQTLRDRQNRLRHQLMRVQPSQLQASLDDHRALAAALAAGDAARYAEVLHAHVASHRGAL